MNKKDKNTVKLILDLKKSPVMSKSQKQRLVALAAQPDDTIDYSDAPAMPDAIWEKAVKLPEPKRQVTLRIDADVLEFFKHTSSHYQTSINAVLRSYFEAHKLPG
ncbi:BrnA antitoxin family protein [Klebsiella sp. BIGb0407]|uniref:BrnA antitoxin family protein n=1 Tax=Klebsiella sp. BIGb0407 TaxID=2940603 RepID=UPI00216707AD|nr:BrnA antitoxin family protein [Klebsiella sp. BIGb0407]MCS3433055.1 uncharacterized protein (DUF4415 family) [Klebsiella sp. BIGb0407]